LSDTLVEAIEFDGRKAVAVLARRQGKPIRFEASEIIVSAGALHSPGILMRAGIGPADHLQDLGIPVLATGLASGRTCRTIPWSASVFTSGQRPGSSRPY
jgi:5-(hydroxymethyl)furfural/furfural oxidase